MSVSNFKTFNGEVKETLKLTNDNYLYLSAFLVCIATIISMVADYFVPGFFFASLLLVLAPLIMGLSSYFVTPNKQPIEQKQKYFFRLVKQFIRFDSIRILIPFRTFIFAFLWSLLAFYLSSFFTLMYALTYDPAATAIYQTFLDLLASSNDYNAAVQFLSDNLTFMATYSFIPLVTLNLTFVVSMAYMLIKRLFFVYIHVNLFTKTRAKIDQIKVKYFDRQPIRWSFRKYYNLYITPVLLLGLIVSIALVIICKSFFATMFNDLTIVLLSSLIFVLTIFLFFKYILAVQLVIFGLFMEDNAVNIYKESIKDIDLNVVNVDLTNEEKQRLLEIKKLLETQIVLFETEKNKQDAETKK